MHTTFTYNSAINLETELDTARIRMCVKETGYNSYTVDMPVRNVLRYTNSNNLMEATGLLTLAACAGALNVFVMHNSYWASSETGSANGEPTPFRGIPIIDANKMVLPICNENFLAQEHKVEDEGRKAKITVPMGFETCYDISSVKTGDGEVEDAQKNRDQVFVPLSVSADIAVMTRTVKGKEPTFLSGIKATDFRLAPHGAMSMDIAHVMTYFAKPEADSTKQLVVMNIDYNAAPNVGGLQASMTGEFL